METILGNMVSSRTVEMWLRCEEDKSFVLQSYKKGCLAWVSIKSDF